MVGTLAIAIAKAQPFGILPSKSPDFKLWDFRSPLYSNGKKKFDCPTVHNSDCDLNTGPLLGKLFEHQTNTIQIPDMSDSLNCYVFKWFRYLNVPSQDSSLDNIFPGFFLVLFVQLSIFQPFLIELSGSQDRLTLCCCQRM